MNVDVIIDKFTSFNSIEVIKAVQYTPDVCLTLLLIDDKKYVLAEADYFDQIHEGNGVKELFSLRVIKWIFPKKYDKTKYDDRALRIGDVVCGLAEVK